MKIKDRIEAAGETDSGCVRSNNEDNFTIDSNLGLLVVADGMGGHNSGEVASDLAAKTLLECARRMLSAGPLPAAEAGRPELSPLARMLERCVKSANAAIFEKGRALAKDEGMGTTVVAALMDSKTLVVAHVGDSRLYLWRQGQLTQLTEDHSLVGEQVRRGQISADEASRSNLQNILTRALGADGDVDVDVSEHPLMPEDVVLLATDGLSKMVSDAEVARTLSGGGSPQMLVNSLISQARSAGGADNVTVVIARVPHPSAGGLRELVLRLFGRG